MLSGKRILLIIGGGIAAYKALDLIRRLREQGASVRGVLTAGGAEFITPLSVAALTEDQVFTSLFDLKDEAEMGHIQLSRQADLILVCPATADLMAKMAAGLAGDLATTVLLATDKLVIIVPAMNVRMWTHPATQANLSVLRARGVGVIGPTDGAMACGEFGPGRMSDVPDIVAAVAAHFGAGPLSGKHVIVTAGPTHEPIDPVRYLANRSSGKQGYALAGALAALGARVTLVSGPVALPTPPGVTRVAVETARDMAAAVDDALPADAFLGVAAVADWAPEAAPSKLKKGAGNAPPALALHENPDILAKVSALPHGQRPRLVVGFAAETNNVLEHAQAKRARKGCDWIIANDVSAAGDVPGGVMGADDNRIHLISAAGVDSWPVLPKAEVARRLAQKVSDVLL
jgi:phosphopantothenoylcysteine decarboxylase / phosphopantothenate---cysteine ligase